VSPKPLSAHRKRGCHPLWEGANRVPDLAPTSAKQLNYAQFSGAIHLIIHRDGRAAGKSRA
jgi:hypothetical protein